MNEPDVSSSLLRLAGSDFTKNLKSLLIDLADSSDDEAYASRLRLVASGKRPLRSLMTDPKWIESLGPEPSEIGLPVEIDDDLRRKIEDLASRAQEELPTLSGDDVASDIVDVMRRAELVRDAVNEGGWSRVYRAGDDSDSTSFGGR